MFCAMQKKKKGFLQERQKNGTLDHPNIKYMVERYTD